MDTSIPNILYPPSSSSEARRIWDECQLGSAATTWAVTEAVGIWAYFNAELYDIFDHSGNKVVHVMWTSPSDVKYTMTWDAYIAWFKCACQLKK